MPWIDHKSATITSEELAKLLRASLDTARKKICAQPRRVLLLPPDITRMHSGAGRITESLYELLSPEADVHVIPTLGQHIPHTPAQNREMFGAIPNERIHAHDWLDGCTAVGEIPAEFVRQSCGGAADWGFCTAGRGCIRGCRAISTDRFWISAAASETCSATDPAPSASM